MANRTGNGIKPSRADGIKNYFIGKWKRNVSNSDFILCATVPFVRNLIEYTKGENDPDYLKLTSLLHWKENTAQITVGEYYDIYNRPFNTNYPINNGNYFFELLFIKANEIKDRANHDGLNLEDKVLLSIAIRMKAEIFLINRIRRIKNDNTY